jgi:UDP-glucose:glycoprotein glucosyltransferase
VIVAMNSFKSKIIRIKVAKKADKQGEKLLLDEQEEQESSLWNSISK